MIFGIGWLLDDSRWMPRSACGDWTTGLTATWIVGNVLIAGVYWYIPVRLYFAWRHRRRERAWRVDMLLWFAAFISLCGLTHLFEITVFWWPAYRLYSGVLFVAGLVSLVTAVRLGPAIDEVMRQPTRQMLHEARDLAHAKAAEAALARELERQYRREVEASNRDLRAKVDRLEALMRGRVWNSEARDEIDEIRAELSRR